VRSTVTVTVAEAVSDRKYDDDALLLTKDVAKGQVGVKQRTGIYRTGWLKNNVFDMYCCRILASVLNVLELSDNSKICG
jgi:hypothetical protein